MIIVIFVAKIILFMRTKRSSNSNMSFLKGNVLFFALLLLAIMLFTYYALREVRVAGGENASCRIVFNESFDCGECKVFVDDSLLYAGAPMGVDTLLLMKRYATAGSKVSLYTSKSFVKVVVGADTVQRVLGGDRFFSVGACDGVPVIDAIEE